MSFVSRYGHCRSGLQCWRLHTNSFHARTAGRVVVAMTTLLRPPWSRNVVKIINCKKRVQELLLSVLRTDGMGGKAHGGQDQQIRDAGAGAAHGGAEQGWQRWEAQHDEHTNWQWRQGQCDGGIWRDW